MLRVRTKLPKSASQEEALEHRRARFLAAGVYAVYSRDALKDYRVILLSDGRVFCTCDASIDYDLLKATHVTRYLMESNCWHKAAVARRLLSHPVELKLAIR
jgi:hypothetical protein